MLFYGSITDAAKQASATALPQVVMVGDAHHQKLFVAWCAMNHFEHNAVISIINKGSFEESQLDQVVREKGIVPRVHIIPPAGRGLTPTCLFGAKGFAEEAISQAIATAGGIMMSYGDVVDQISSAYVDKELRNASQEMSRTLARGMGGPVPAAASSSSAASSSPASLTGSKTIVSPTSPNAAASPAKASAASPPPNANASPSASSSAAVVSPPPAAAAAASSSSAAADNKIPNVKVTLRIGGEGMAKSHPVYTNNLWSAASQLAKGHNAARFALEMGRSDAPKRIYEEAELSSLPITEGCTIRLNLDPPKVAGATAAATTAPAVSAAPATNAATTTSSPTTAGGGEIEIRFTLPTGTSQQLSFDPSTTLAEVRKRVAETVLTSDPKMAAYCANNGMSTTEFSLVASYPKRKLEDNDETNSKPLSALGLGKKFALLIVMAFVSGGAPAAAAAGAGAAPQGTITGSIGGLLGRFLGGGGAKPAEE